MSLELILQNLPIVQQLVAHFTPIDFICLYRASPIFFRQCLNRLQLNTHVVFRLALVQAFMQLPLCDCKDAQTNIDHRQATVRRFLHAIDTREMWLTGGFLLDVLQGETSRFNITSSNVDVLTCEWVDPNWMYIGDIFPSITDAEYDRGQEPVTKRTRTNAAEFESDSYWYWGDKLIHLKSLVPGSLTAYVNQRDFAFTRNIYGGKKLRIMDLNAVVKKRCHVNVSKTYLKRTDPSYIIVSPNTIVENTCRRIRKYQALGYTIDLTHVRFENFQEEFKEEENDWFRLRAFANVWKDKTRYDRKTRTYHVLAIE